MMDCGKLLGLVFTLAEPGPGMSVASLNYSLHVNAKLYKQPHRMSPKNTEIHIQGQPYLSATVATAKVQIVLNHKFSALYIIFIIVLRCCPRAFV